jgi:hypothetical protein
MSLFYKEMKIIIIGGELVITNILCIINHSMAIHMSKKLLDIINTQ